jgi:hypothetical protein
VIQRIAFLVFIMFFVGCSKTEEERIKPMIVMKTGDFTVDGSSVPVGGKLSFGITAIEGSAPITNLRIRRIAGGKTITELDKGLYIPQGGLDYTFNAVKSAEAIETWTFMVMNANRDTTQFSLTVLLGEGSAYGPVLHFPSIIIGMQNHSSLPQYLDLHSGTLYTSTSVSGHEAAIDMVGFVYQTGGVMSPTLCCPAYSGSSSVTGHYPAIANWVTRNSTLYDYYTSDNQLISEAQFDGAANDSLLVSAYKPGNVSGLCKYAYAGRVIPFKTEDGKYGMIKMKRADIDTDGVMEFEVKIQP